MMFKYIVFVEHLNWFKVLRNLTLDSRIRWKRFEASRSTRVPNQCVVLDLRGGWPFNLAFKRLQMSNDTASTLSEAFNSFEY